MVLVQVVLSIVLQVFVLVLLKLAAVVRRAVAIQLHRQPPSDCHRVSDCQGQCTMEKSRSTWSSTEDSLHSTFSARTTGPCASPTPSCGHLNRLNFVLDLYRYSEFTFTK